MQNPSGLGDALRRIREAADLTMRKFAEKTSLPVASVSDYENDKQVPRPEILEKISRMFNVPYEVLAYFAYIRCRNPNPINSDFIVVLNKGFCREFGLAEAALKREGAREKSRKAKQST